MFLILSFLIHPCVIPLKDKNGITSTNIFQKTLDKSRRKPNKICVDKICKFYNRSMKFWLEKNDIQIYSVYNKIKFVVAERFIRTLMDKIYNYVTSKYEKMV